MNFYTANNSWTKSNVTSVSPISPISLVNSPNSPSIIQQKNNFI